MFDVFERLAIHDKSIKKLVEVTDNTNKVINGMIEREKYGTQLDVLQALIQADTDKRLDELESGNFAERLDHMEEYIDKLTKRVKELESKSNSINTSSRGMCNHCGTSH